jgi:hypothetical protein
LTQRDDAGAAMPLAGTAFRTFETRRCASDGSHTHRASERRGTMAPLDRPFMFVEAGAASSARSRFADAGHMVRIASLALTGPLGATPAIETDLWLRSAVVIAATGWRCSSS